MINYLINKPITTIMITLVSILIGIQLLIKLDISIMPKTENPAITIITRYPSISPQKIEEVLTKPIEEQITGIGGIESIYSTSEEGESRINITFIDSVNISYKSLEIRAKIDLIRASFPREVDEPILTRYDPSDRPIYIIKLESSILDLKELRSIADNKIKKSLERIDGVSEIKLGGGFEREYVVNLDQDKLNTMKIPVNTVMSSLRNSNINFPVGDIIYDSTRIKLLIDGRFKNIFDIKYTPIQSIDNKIIHIKDIAIVEDGYRDRENISREDGKEIISIYIFKSGDANTLNISRKVNEYLKGINYNNISIETTLDQSELIISAINNVVFNAIIGGFAAMFFLLIFLRSFRSILIIGITIPTSIFISFIFLYIFDIGINIMSLSGMAIGVGMLIDSSIIFIDRLFHNFNHSHYNIDLIKNTILEIKNELIASVSTSVCVFIPFFFATKDTNKIYGGLAITVSTILIVSLLITLYILPTLTKYFIYHNESKFTSMRSEKILSVSIDKFAVLLIRRLHFTRFILNYDYFKKAYEEALSFCILNSRITFSFLFLLLFCGLLSYSNIKTEYMESGASGEIKASIELETGVHLDATDKRIRRLESIIKQNVKIEKVSLKIEKWHADAYIFIKEKYWNQKDQIIDELKISTKSVPDAFLFFSDASDLSSKEIDIEFIGDDTEQLQTIAKEAASKIGEIDGIQQVALRFREGKDEIIINLNHNKTSISNLNIAQITNDMKTLNTGSIPSKFLEMDREVDIKVRLAEPFRKSKRDYLANLFSSNDNKSISISSISNITLEKGETRIYRKNKRKVASITAKLSDIDTGSAVKLIEDALNKMKYPENTYWEFTGNVKKMKENQIEMLLLILFSFVIIYLILSSLFESFFYPILILINIPIGILGTIPILYLFNQSLNISVYIGFIMIIGIGVNNSIFYVESFIKRIDLVNFKERVSKAGKSRLRPILITTLTTIFGLMPAAISFGSNSQLWKPLAITVISGLIISSFSTLLVLPALLVLYHEWKKKS